jgi:hypothetical protein
MDAALRRMHSPSVAEYQFGEIARIAVAVPGVSDQEQRSLFKVEPSQLRCRVVLPAVFRLHECVPLPRSPPREHPIKS